MKTENPFSLNSDRWLIWEMLVTRDIKAFVNADWDMVADDFVAEGFMGTDACKQGNPDAWKLSYPDLNAYREEWLTQAKSYKSTDWQEDPEHALFRVTTLRDIEIRGDSALVHKKFFGNLRPSNESDTSTEWQTLYRCRKVAGSWKIAGFTGYMPHWPGPIASSGRAIQVPAGAHQHVTAGPYSPVLEINARSLVVISGQAAINLDGQIIGATIEEQTALTMDNCQNQLNQAGCTLDDVFKVNVFLTDLDDWPRFNEVYKSYFKNPLPVRTAIGSGLLMTLQVEIEMWAAKS